MRYFKKQTQDDIQKSTIHEDPWSGTVASRTMKLFLATASKLKKTVKQIDFISAFLQGNVRGRHFVSLPAEYNKNFFQSTANTLESRSC